MAFDVSRFGLAPGALPSRWHADRLDSISSFNPEKIGKAFPHSSIQYLDIANVGAGTIGKPVHLSLADAPSRAQRVVRAQDTIIATVRPGNRAYCFLTDVPPNLVVSTGFAVLRARCCDPRFLYYLATSDPLIDYLTSIAEEKTAYPAVNPADMAECVVPIPPLPEQRAIGHVLGVLDDKIELNRRMNETLESVARAIFKSWFVDFDAVGAKMEGRQPIGMDAETASLFPDAFEDSPLGRVPKGWPIVRLDELVELRRDAVAPGNRPTEEFDHYSIPAFDGGKMPTVETGEQIKSNKFAVPPDSILLSKLNPRIPRVWLPGVGGSRTSICSTEFLVALARPPLSREYLYTFFLSKPFQETIATMVTGTSSSHQRVRPVDVASMDTLRPDPELTKRFTDVTQPLYRRLQANLNESQTLAAIRDVLLPKLLSGKVRMNQTEEVREPAS